jgi:hypothetical protein
LRPSACGRSGEPDIAEVASNGLFADSWNDIAESGRIGYRFKSRKPLPLSYDRAIHFEPSATTHSLDSHMDFDALRRLLIGAWRLVIRR